MKQVQSSGIKLFISSKRVVFGLMAILAVVAIGLIQQTVKYFVIKKEILKLARDIKRQEEQNLEMNRTSKYLRSKFYQEKEARLKFGLQKPGEKLIVITSSGSKEDVGLLPATEKSTNPVKWWKYFAK